MSDLDETLAQRGNKYGKNWEAYSRMKEAMTAARNKKPSKKTIQNDDIITYAIDMILMKLSRIAAGDENYTDNWHDIAGYATLVENHLENNKNTSDSTFPSVAPREGGVLFTNTNATPYSYSHRDLMAHGGCDVPYPSKD